MKIDIPIRYDQDLMKAKQVLEYIMIGDPRILQKPRPAVFVTHLRPDGVALGGRCWVNNLKYWRTRCDLLEKVKLGFDNHKIAFAHPKRDVHIRNCGDDEPKMDMDVESNTPENIQ
jgi:small conductance mechanosensitive channel